MQRYYARAAASPHLGDKVWLTRLAATPIPKVLADAHSELAQARMASRNSEIVAVVATPENAIILYIHDAAKHTLKPWNSLVGHTATIVDISFGVGDEYGHFLISASADGHAVGWNLCTGEPVLQFSVPSRKPFTSCAINGQFFAGVGEFGVALWSLKTQRLVALDEEIHTELATYCRFHPVQTGMLFTGSDDCMVNVFNLDSLNQGGCTELEDCLELVFSVEQPVSRFYFGGDNCDTLVVLSVNEEFSAWSISSGDLLVKPSCARDLFNKLVIQQVGIAEESLVHGPDDQQEQNQDEPIEDDAAFADMINRELREVEERERQQRRLVQGEAGDRSDEKGETKTIEDGPTFEELVEVEQDEYGNSLYSFPVEGKTNSDTVIPTKIPAEGWRIVGLIGSRVDPATGVIQIAASTLMGGIVIASFSGEDVSLTTVIPPASGHVDIVRDFMWSDGKGINALSCGQDSRVVLHRRSDDEKSWDAGDRAAEARTLQRIRKLKQRITSRQFSDDLDLRPSQDPSRGRPRLR